MKNPLRKRLLRELVSEFGKYLVIFLFMAVTIGFVSGFLVAGDSMIQAYDESFEKYQIEDGHFEMQDELKSSLIEKLEDGNKAIYPLYYKDMDCTVEQEKTSGLTIRIYENRTDINKICVMEGCLPEKENEIGLDRMFADNNGLKVGDSIQIGEQNMTITGLVALSDYSALFSDNNDTMFDAVKFGVACVSSKEFRNLPDDNIHYTYAWRYDQRPENDKQESEWSDDFMELLAKQAMHSGLTIEDYLPQYGNQAIHFTGDDMGGDRQMMIVLLYIIIVIMAFVFSVTIKHTITKEAAVIGTLRASGYTKKELFVHYITMPVLVSLLAAIVGNILGYTAFKDVVAGMYYGSYSLPTYITIWNADAFILTTVYPLLIMIVTNGYVLIQRLQLSPLQFIRRDLTKNKKKKAIRLPHIKFFRRFRIRIILQNRSNYVTLFLGILFADVLMVFGLMMGPLIKDYQAIIINNMVAKYQYVLSAQVETENPDAEKYCLTGLSYHAQTRNEDVSVYGIVDHSRYFDEKMPDDGVLIADGIAQKYGVKKGDTIQLYEPYGNEVYSFEVKDIIYYPNGLAVFMSYDQYIRTFDPDTSYMENLLSDPALFLKQFASAKQSEYFTGYFSNEKLTDIDEKYISSCITEDDLTKLTRQMDVSMGSMFEMVKYFALVLAAMLIYLLTKVILEKNANSISMVKILGYENGEIASLYLMSTTFVVILSVIVGMFLATAFMSVIWKAVMISFNGWISISIPMIVYPQLFLLMMAGYFAVALLQFRKIKKIPMEDALKNIE